MMKTGRKLTHHAQRGRGGMGDNRMNLDLSLTEEYAHSGHHHPSMNNNAEGYIESNPAINAPGAMAAAGFSNCHMQPSPCEFSVSTTAAISTEQFAPASTAATAELDGVQHISQYYYVRTYLTISQLVGSKEMKVSCCHLFCIECHYYYYYARILVQE